MTPPWPSSVSKLNGSSGEKLPGIVNSIRFTIGLGPNSPHCLLTMTPQEQEALVANGWECRLYH